MQILKEEIAKPTVTKDDILAYLIKYRKLNMKQLDHRRRLIDSFVNAIYLFDDYLVITFNYKEGTKTITFAEIEEAFGSDLSSLTAPNKWRHATSCRFFVWSVYWLAEASQRQRRWGNVWWFARAKSSLKIILTILCFYGTIRENKIRGAIWKIKEKNISYLSYCLLLFY